MGLEWAGGWRGVGTILLKKSLVSSTRPRRHRQAVLHNSDGHQLSVVTDTDFEQLVADNDMFWGNVRQLAQMFFLLIFWQFWPRSVSCDYGSLPPAISLLYLRVFFL